ncbi:isoprenyl transferase [Thiomicrorhabdus immobilis]|uniref:Ditrans,polycis-undecaprenyl-diphosphate synthase ((2E,6E)-farnesyl-diphosphate specific) n=1 Tax=Thiomicrorhabdus immobilis TaxID=2791037 RepID=A0ABM7MDG7_9GAMM|nr:isoprenyl transferase [Thiomicrorhabdus immobilis]BCN93439.1 isoprenyl transferase [Thiomicrorhabdus immobilis]
MSEIVKNPHLPKHIAIIMDGNGRWAKKRLLPRFVGHQKGLNAVKRIVSYSSEIGIEALTLFAFSTENWKRPKDEVNKLMGLFLKALQKEVKKLSENNVQLRIIGDRSAFSEEIQQHIVLAEQMTQNNTGLVLSIAANYGGRADIVEAVKQWQLANPAQTIHDLSENDLTHFVALADLPEPDLLIRTGGEQRISNFLIWQMAYAELYFTDALWPDFDEKQLDMAIESFSKRERRFGQTSEQVNK